LSPSSLPAAITGAAHRNFGATESEYTNPLLSGSLAEKDPRRHEELIDSKWSIAVSNWNRCSGFEPQAM